MSSEKLLPNQRGRSCFVMRNLHEDSPRKILTKTQHLRISTQGLISAVTKIWPDVCLTKNLRAACRRPKKQVLEAQAERTRKDLAVRIRKTWDQIHL